jgi:putative NADH-flavin reductase
MNILIFGATGGTGRYLVTQGLKKGHHITAFVRNPKKLIIKNKNLSFVQGDVLNIKDVQEAVRGQDVVISVLGNKTSDALWKSNTIISDGVRNIISAMKKYKVKHLLFVASFGVNEKIFLPEKLFIRIILKNIFADIPKQEELIKKSSLDYILVHPSRLINGSRTGKYKAGENLPIGLFSKISRADVADFLLKNINVSPYIRKTVTISY